MLKPGAQGAKLQIPAAIWVQPGDTAGALVASHLDPALDRSQALWALAQANPDAFVGGNVNRLRAGAVLKWPESNQIQSLDPVQAREAIAQQMEEFAAYRSELASLAGPTQADESAQVATGKVQPAQKDKAEKTTDQLTLSTAGADGTDQIAAQRQAQQTAERAAEINRNIQELNRIVQGDNQAGVSVPATALELPASELIEIGRAHV